MSQERLNIDEMRRVLVGVLDLDVDDLSIKATTTERLGFRDGKNGGAYATVLVYKS